MKNTWREHRVLIWGKTYPELSSKYYETVCTGGTLEDGRFVRLYPIPFRYLSDNSIFSKYQWVRLRIKKAEDDPRPESYKVDPASITVEESVPSDKQGWKLRAKSVFRNSGYQFDNVEELLKANKEKKVSLGFVYPATIDSIKIERRPEEEYLEFEEKLRKNKQRLTQEQLFPIITVEELKSLKYVSHRFKIQWRCKGTECKGHNMSVLDWEAYELVRKVGLEKAKQKIEEIVNLKNYHTGFFLGNFRLHPTAFGIGGLWYPKKEEKPSTYNLFED